MKSVMLSIKPKWLDKIANGEKTIEVRKSRPKIETPFKCYIYCTKQRMTKVLCMYSYLHINEPKASLRYGERITTWGNIGDVIVNRTTPYEYVSYGLQGIVIGDFVCDKIEEFHEYELSPSKKFYEFEKARLDLFLKESCLSYNEVCDYRKNLPYYKPLYGWHITDLKIYDKPEELSKFFTPMGKRPSYMIERPPQSYMYVEEL